MLQQYVSLVTGDPTQLAMIGRNLFHWYTALQVAAVSLLAPLLVASGVQEEKESRTLDLLALTGVSAGRILFDQVSSRLFALLVVILGGAPFLALLSTFGGIGPAEAINAILGAILLAVVLGFFAGHAALVTRGGPLLALAFCIPYALFALGMQPLVAGMIDEDVFIALSPVSAAWSDEPWMPLTIPLWIGVLWSGWGLSVPVFRIMAAGDEADDEFGLLSPDIWAIERFKKRTWMWSIVGLGGWLVLPLTFLDPIPRDFRELVALLLTPFALVAGHRLSLLATLWAGQRLGAMSLPSFSLWGRRHTRPRAIHGPPVVWREVATRAAGAARLLPIPLVGFWLLGAFLWELAEGFGNEELVIGAFWAAFFGMWIPPLVATATMLDERRRRTTQLLLLTRLSPLGIAAQKVVAPVLFALPLFALGAGMVGLLGEPYYTHAEGHNHQIWSQHLFAGVPGMTVLGWMVWQSLVAANLALMGALVAASVKRPRAAWMIAVLGTMAYAGWPVLLLLGLQALGLRPAARELDDWLIHWYPMGGRWALECDEGGISPWILIASGVQLCILPIGLTLLAERIKRLI